MQFIWEFYFEILLNDQRMKIDRQNPWICFASSAEEEVLGEQRRGVCALMCVCVCVCVCGRGIFLSVYGRGRCRGLRLESPASTSSLMEKAS